MCPRLHRPGSEAATMLTFCQSQMSTELIPAEGEVSMKTRHAVGASRRIRFAIVALSAQVLACTTQSWGGRIEAGRIGIPPLAGVEWRGECTRAALLDLLVASVVRYEARACTENGSHGRFEVLSLPVLGALYRVEPTARGAAHQIAFFVVLDTFGDPASNAGPNVSAGAATGEGNP